jgi:uncharacterized lipoprotein YajG
MRLILVVLLCLVSAGCAYIDQNLKVDPEASVTSDNIGGGRKIAVRVIDDRDEQLIGKRGAQFLPGGKISSKQDLAEVLEEDVREGLLRKGFEPVKEHETGLLMKVELRSLEYNSSMGLWTAGNIGTAVIKVTATAPSGKIYEETYRSESEVRTAFISSQVTNARVVNNALSEAINKIFEDRELVEFLAREPIAKQISTAPATQEDKAAEQPAAEN